MVLVLAVHTVATVSAKVPFAMIMLRYQRCLLIMCCIRPSSLTIQQTRNRTAYSSVSLDYKLHNLQGSRKEERCVPRPALQIGIGSHMALSIVVSRSNGK